MSVRVDVLRDEDAPRTDVTLTGPRSTGPAALEYETLLVPGVRLTVDLERPTCWRRVSVRGWTDAIVPQVSALAGDRTTREIAAVVAERPSARQSFTSDTLTINPVRAAPWLRVAVVHGLDRWLHLPLEQSLVHAEIGISRLRAALSLPGDAVLQETLLDDALSWGRPAAHRVAHVLRDLARDPRPLPSALRRSVTNLVDGYAELRALVAEPDAALSAVVDSWRSALPRTAPHDDLANGYTTSRSAETLDAGSDGVSMIDPRQVRARVLQLGDEPESPEIALSATRANDEDAVRIEVPAFDRRVDPEIARRLVARLVDRRSGDPHSHAALAVRTSTRTKFRPSLFHCTLPLRGAAVEDLRAEVFDALLRPRHAVSGTDDELLQARTAVLSLRRSRSLAALAALRGSREAQGPGRPLVAELVAAYQTREA